MVDVGAVLADLVAEQESLDAVVRDLDAIDLARPTPSPGWSVAHQIAHLTWFDMSAALAIADPDEFLESRDALISAAMADPAAVDRLTLGDLVDLPVDQLLGEWRAARGNLALAASTLGGDDRVDWYGPSMSARSFLTARLMEVWAHGQDVIDALEDPAPRPATDRLRHIAHLGFVTRRWSYAVRGDEAPDAEVLVELVAPSGEPWAWGPDDADNIVRGPAEDFCLVVTQRRHVEDTELDVTGEAAADWMRVAQAFAGGPTEGPRPRG